MKVVVDSNSYEPTRAHPTDAGIDLRSNECGVIPARCSRVFKTGTHVELPHGTCGLIVSKSGLNVNHCITSTGLIDEGYQGQILVRLYNYSDRPYTVMNGDKIAQLVVLPVLYENIEIVDSFDKETERGTDGFGSTGRS